MKIISNSFFLLAGSLALLLSTSCNGQPRDKELNAEEMRQQRDSDRVSIERQLTFEVERINNELPAQVDPMTTFEKVTVNGRKVVFHYVIDDGARGVVLVDEKKLHASLLASLPYQATNAAQLGFFVLCVRTGTDITYSYETKVSGSSVQTVITPSELAKIVKERPAK